MTTASRRRALARAAGAFTLAVGTALGCVTLSAVAANAATKPARVTGFAVKGGSVTSHGATFYWNKDARVNTYRIVIVNASTPTTAAAYSSNYTLRGTWATVSTLAPGTAYKAKISAGVAGNASKWSSWVFFYTTGAQGPTGKTGPKGAAGATGARGPAGIGAATMQIFASDPSGNNSVQTGGEFADRAKNVGSFPLEAGTYLISVNFTATPNATTGGAVFPQAFIYNGQAKSDFSNDQFNVGSGALAPFNATDANDEVNSYYSGTDLLTVPAGGETVNVYAFGYDADHGAGSYELNSLAVSTVRLNVPVSTGNLSADK